MGLDVTIRASGRGRKEEAEQPATAAGRPGDSKTTARQAAQQQEREKAGRKTDGTAEARGGAQGEKRPQGPTTNAAAVAKRGRGATP